MKILLYGINYSPELTGTGKYTGEMGAWFAAQYTRLAAFILALEVIFSQHRDNYDHEYVERAIK